MFGFFKIVFLFFIFIQFSYASGSLSTEFLHKVKKTKIVSDEEIEKLSITAGFLAEYEFKVKKILSLLNEYSTDKAGLNEQANQLLGISEKIIDSARFRLPQCDKYLEKTLILKDYISIISAEKLEEQYHQDGALPKAPSECYHTKDLFVHPATVVVLLRDKPLSNFKTIKTIRAELTEVIAHIEIVRQLVIY